MALTALSVTQSIKPESAFDGDDGPLGFYGVLNGTSTSYLSGCPLIASSGTLDEAAVTTLAGETILGFLSKVAPRRVDINTPLTSGTAPAASIPGQRTTPASGAGRFTDMNDVDFGVTYHPNIPGQLWSAHLVVGTANGSDYRAQGSADIYRLTGYARTKTSGAGNDEVNYATKTGLWTLATATASTTNDTETKIVWYSEPQPTSLSGTAFANVPGALVENGTSTGTFNPLVIFVSLKSALFTA